MAAWKDKNNRIQHNQAAEKPFKAKQAQYDQDNSTNQHKEMSCSWILRPLLSGVEHLFEENMRKAGRQEGRKEDKTFLAEKERKV
jgi:ribonuclease HI